MRDAIRHSFRFLSVIHELARHDALFWVDDLGRAPAGIKTAIRLMTGLVFRKKDLPQEPGARLAAALRELGPAYIKLGQMLATRPDLMGDAIARDLSSLQDRLPPFSAGIARARVESELGCPLDTVFAEFSPQPVAAASIAQVHKARKHDGAWVAVKILRPGVRAAFERDLAAFSWFAGIAERSIPKARRLRPVAVVDTIKDSVANELNLRLEAAAASELAENMAGTPGYRIPAIDWEFTTGRMMTMEWVDGIPLSDNEGLEAAGFDRAALASTIVRAFLLQAMRDAFFTPTCIRAICLFRPMARWLRWISVLSGGWTGNPVAIWRKSSTGFCKRIIEGWRVGTSRQAMCPKTGRKKPLPRPCGRWPSRFSDGRCVRFPPGGFWGSFLPPRKPSAWKPSRNCCCCSALW
ncbi:hypothetical protein JCM17843_00360 [Kordiimonadales bacterium JCM 17843]|nr:hypothetical protein JCM17843_00360 [Kordiimonadales bacterium JCM 17843]